MSSVNLPASLYDMFQSINDRINRLELGYNGPQASADAAQGLAASAQALALSSQSTATAAQIQAINAGIQANLAASQATIAQSQATIASSQAVAAQTSANGKNTIHYSSSTPSGSGTNVGDIWWQYSGSTLIGQWSWNGSSWNPAPITNSVISNLDAGKITTGILNAIEINAGTGGTAFHVSPSGYLSAQGVYIKGNITADSGTFNGSINANAGYFGNYSGGNYWSIGSTGITGVGSATITAGLIQGSSIAIPSSLAYNFAVDSSGNMTATAGTIGGFSIQTGYLTYGGQTWLNASGGVGSGTYCLYDSSRGIYLGGTMKASAIDLGSYGWTSSGTITAGTVNSTNVVTATITGNTAVNIVGQTTITGNLQVTAMSSTSATGVVWSSSNNRFYLTTSTERHKDNITPIPTADYLSKILELEPVTFNYKPEYTDNPDQLISGLIAEKVAEIPEFATTVNLDKDGLPESIAYDRLAVFFIPAIKQINDRLTKLEGK